MGNQQPSGQNFNQNEWTQISTNPNLITLWQNNHNPNIHIEEHRIYTIDQQQMAQQRQLYFQRKNHPFLVAAYYFQEEKSTQICVNRSVAHIFIQKIPIKIFDLRDLPIPDLIHAYNQCLEGYKNLARTFGCFRVSNQFIGVNQKGTVKVWAGAQWSHIGIVGNRITQQQMVRSIIESLQSCNENPVNQHIPTLSIKNYLYRNNDRIVFDQAIQQLRNFALEFNDGFIPSRLESLYHNQNFQMFLDPLLRSNHHISESKHVSHPQSSNGQATFKKVDSGQMVYGFGNINQGREIYKKDDKRSSLTFFNCMNDDQKLKTSKMLTNEEALNIHTGNTQVNQQIHQNIHLLQNNPNAQPNYQPMQAAPALSNPNRAYSQNFTSNNVQNTFIQSTQPVIYNQARPAQRKALVPTPSQPNLGQSLHFQYKTTSSMHIPSQPNHFNPPTLPLPYQIPKNHHPIQTNHQNQVFGNQVANHPQPISSSYRSYPVPQQAQKQPYSQTQRRKRPIPQSIIMQLYTPEDKSHNDYPTLKSFGLVKQSVSQMEQPQHQLRFESATLIKDGEPTSLTGFPNNTFVPHTNTNLHSIQELSSQHWKNDNISYTSSPSRPPSELPMPWGESEIKKYDYSKFQQRRNSHYLKDLNDGKTPESLLNSIKELRNIQPYQHYPQKLYR